MSQVDEFHFHNVDGIEAPVPYPSALADLPAMQVAISSRRICWPSPDGVFGPNGPARHGNRPTVSSPPQGRNGTSCAATPWWTARLLTGCASGI